MNCTCQTWKENIDKVNAPIMLAAARSGGRIQYDGKPFAFCPWCGVSLTKTHYVLVLLRINRVINTESFIDSLIESGKDLMDFQLEWPQHASFEALPEYCRKAIEAGEAELSRAGTVKITE